MRKIWIPVFAACLGLAGSETLVHAGLLSSTGAVIAILADDLFVGEAEGHLSGAGTLAIHSQTNPELTCLGQFTSSAALGGSGQMHCSDGTSMTFQFQRLTVLRGYGVGSGSRGMMSFAYGLTADEAGPYLRLPEGKKLTPDGTELKLVNRQGKDEGERRFCRAGLMYRLYGLRAVVGFILQPLRSRGAG